jgi:catechol 2,3-dioxygenase-like lactoylglutathione lyase family enzyme
MSGTLCGVRDDLMLDHISIRVADYERSKKFYEAALTTLGYSLAMENASGAGFAREFIPNFWIKQGEPTSSQLENTMESGCGGPAVHVAFASDNRSMVDAFHRAALDAGARDNGGPQLRPDYHPNYYGAFVLDPDGYNIEAVCHRAE